MQQNSDNMSHKHMLMHEREMEIIRAHGSSYIFSKAAEHNEFKINQELQLFQKIQ